MIGRQIDGFKILARLGAGGFGVVYKAHDVALNRFVALKFLLETVNLKDMGRFAEEARKLARLGKHPNIIQVYGSGKYEGRDYVVLEYAHCSAADLIEQAGGALSVLAALRIAAGCAQALAYTHREGIIHRDIKPQNILIDKASGRAQIADFGIACFYESEIATRSSTRLGTPHYVSPEQVAGRRVDQRSDVFSLGATLHELLSGHKLFPGNTPYELLDNIKNGRRIPLNRIKPDLPRSVVHLVKKATNHHPSQRFQSAEEFHGAILTILKEIEAEPEPRRSFSRTTLRWIAFGAACLSLICFAAFYTMLPSRSRPPAARAPQSGTGGMAGPSDVPKPPPSLVSQLDQSKPLAAEVDVAQKACEEARERADAFRSATWAKASYDKARESEGNARGTRQNDPQRAAAQFRAAAKLYSDALTQTLQEGDTIAGDAKRGANEQQAKAQPFASYGEADWLQAEYHRKSAENAWNQGDFPAARDECVQAQAAYAKVVETAQTAIQIEGLEVAAREIRAVAEQAQAAQYAKDLYDEAVSLQAAAALAKTTHDYARMQQSLQGANDKYREAARVAFRKQVEAAEADAKGAQEAADKAAVKNHPPSQQAWNEAEALMQSGRELLSTPSAQNSGEFVSLREAMTSATDMFQRAAAMYREAVVRLPSVAPPLPQTDRPTKGGGGRQLPKKTENKARKDYEAFFRKILTDKDPATRETNVQEYVQGGSAGVPVLIKHLGSPAQKEQDLAKDVIGRCGDKAAEDLLKAIEMSAGDAEWQKSREQVAEILASRRDPRAKEALTSVLANLNEVVRVRAACAGGLAQFKGDDSVDALTKALRDQDDQVQEKAAVALGRLGDRRAVGPLSDLLRTAAENPSVRAKAAEALGRLGDPRARQALTDATREADPVLVQRAREAIEAIGKRAGS